MELKIQCINFFLHNTRVYSNIFLYRTKGKVTYGRMWGNTCRYISINIYICRFLF